MPIPETDNLTNQQQSSHNSKRPKRKSARKPSKPVGVQATPLNGNGKQPESSLNEPLKKQVTLSSEADKKVLAIIQWAIDRDFSKEEVIAHLIQECGKQGCPLTEANAIEFYDKARAATLPSLSYEGADRLDYTDLDLAKRFLLRSRGFVIDGRVWNPKTREWSCVESAVSIAVHWFLEQEAKKLLPRIKGDYKIMLSLGSANKAKNVESIVRKLMSGQKAKWDHDPLILGIPDGKVVDLKTGKVREAKPDDYITRYAKVAPSDEEDCPLWKTFLAQVQSPEKVAYLKRLAGYALTGSTKEEMFAFFWGTGGNGKGTWINTISAALGSYAEVIPFSALLSGKKYRHPTEIAKLRGLRLAVSSETSEGRQWNAGTIKTLTGGDRQTGRHMRQDFFDFEPTHKLILSSNSKPSIDHVDEGWRRRLHLAPFTVKPLEVDLDLKEKLLTELPGILRWAINGGLEWQESGLQPPPEVTGATDEYFADQDLVGQWIESYFEKGEGNDFRTASKIYFPMWKMFCQENNEDFGTQRTLTEKLKQRGFKPCTIGKNKDSGLSGFRPIESKAPIVGPIDLEACADPASEDKIQ
jgi:putative DNA primase/helicase